jgi:EAL domain-containing protein (putative c-di-GMP-specific phosphodiesterase class I)
MAAPRPPTAAARKPGQARQRPAGRKRPAAGEDRRIASLTTWYQPVVELDSGRVVGFEALSRHVAADGTARSAGALMDELERVPDLQYALIQRLLTAVQQDMVPLFERRPDFYVSVNIPPSVLGTGRVEPIITGLGLTRWLRRLVVELTERQALTDLGREAIDRARSLGISVALDDFGTGHSGLSQFVGLDLDILKIDQSLLLPVLDNRTAARMLRGIVGLAAALHMRTIAEGIESWEQAFFLRAAGVDHGQGFYWSPAVPGDQVQGLLERGFKDRLERPKGPGDRRKKSR